MNRWRKQFNREIRQFVIVVLSIGFCWSAVGKTPPDMECLNNIRMIDGAKVQLKFEKNLKDGDAIDSTMLTQYFFGGRIPVCPAGGTYTLGPIGALPVCSIKEHSETAVLESIKHRKPPPFPWGEFATRFTALAVPTFALYFGLRWWLKRNSIKPD